jgi:hypothetical protein
MIRVTDLFIGHIYGFRLNFKLGRQNNNNSTKYQLSILDFPKIFINKQLEIYETVELAIFNAAKRRIL